MKSTEALLEAWQQALLRAKDAPAVLNVRGEAVRSFANVEERARGFEAKLVTFSAGSVIAVQIGNHEDWPAIFIACLRRRLVVLPLEQSVGEQQRGAALEMSKATAVVSAVPSGNSLEISPLRTAATTADWGERPPVLLKLTSGTTAQPRAIRFRSEQLLADCNQICDTMGISDTDLNFGAIPISHSYGFSNLLTPLIARGVPMVVSCDRTPRAILADLVRTGATVFPGMPALYQALGDLDGVRALPKLRLCISAGAPLAAAVSKKFFEKFKQPVHSFYGASECGGICYDGDGTAFEDGFVGRPMHGVEIELLDPTASSSQARVRSAAVGDAYFPDPDEQKLGNGVFVPDDLLAPVDCSQGSGILTALSSQVRGRDSLSTTSPRAFKIVGRVSDVINVAGKKVNPAEVEAHLLRCDGVRQAVVFGRAAGAGLRNEEVAACVVASPQVSEGDLLRFCRAVLSAWQVPKRIFMVDAIPTNERGKISRRDLARRFPASSETSPLRRLAS
jgi:long-chain acyl-CoA synthetase